MMKSYKRALLFAFLLPAVFSSCSKPSKVEPEVVTPADFELKDIQYARTGQSGLDTVIVKLNGATVNNLEDVLLTQTYESKYDDLMKTSLFEISNQNALPAGVKLESFEVNVPERWYSNIRDGYFSEKFPLSSKEEQKPYGAYKNELIKVNIPAKSTIVIERQIEAYHMTCSFSAVLVNKATGQQYPISGNWKGISHYNNTSVRLTQRALGTN